jgi:hypothetical protein
MLRWWLKPHCRRVRTGGTPTRPIYLAYPIGVPFFPGELHAGRQWRPLGETVATASAAIGIVACMRCDERSSALLQSRPISVEYYLIAILSSAAHAQTAVYQRHPASCA